MPGLYDQVISGLLHSMLATAGAKSLHVEDAPLDPGESHAALSRYLENVILDALDALHGENRLANHVTV
jgi:hypothetical protein